MKSKTNLLVDLLSFITLLLVLEPAVTGIAIHEWLRLAFFGAIVIHLLLHWKWIVTVGRKFFVKLFHSSRLQFVVDVLLFVVFITAMLSGILISREILRVFNIQIFANFTWRTVHSLSANLTFFLVALHFALHWDWIVTTTKRYLISPFTGIFRKPKKVEPVMVEIYNKDFQSFPDGRL